MTESWKARARPIVAGLALVALAAVGAALIAGGGNDASRPATAPLGNDASTVADRFSALSSARSNRCDLGAAELREMEDEMRLQGSCCFPMDRAAYEEQLRELSRYRRLAVVPNDPYDLSVALAKRLLKYRGIPLDRRKQAYERATELSDLGGPCCCPCWRWQAFKGQAHFLLARRDWSAAEVARLWDAEEGCGGPSDHA